MSSSFFQIKNKSTKSRARTGTLNLAHGVVRTPNFMPIATQGAVKTLSFDDLEKLEADIILTNTYHLWLRPGLEMLEHFGRNKLGSVQQFLGWNKPMLSDSGGFQAFSLSKIRKFSDLGVTFRSHLDGKARFLSPELSMQIQTTIGTDIALVLDECLPAEVDRETAKNAMIRTHKWAQRSKIEFERLKEKGLNPDISKQLEALQFQKNFLLNQNTRDSKKLLENKSLLENIDNQIEELKNSKAEAMNDYPRYLFGIPQGAQFLDLRRESAKRTMDLDFAGYSIGGVANGGEPDDIMYAQVYSQTEVLEEHKPKHLLGVGRPEDIIEMVKAGIDLFDCVYPTRRARHGMLFEWTNQTNLDYQTVRITNREFATNFEIINPNSRFIELRTYTKAYLWHLFKTGEVLAMRLATLNNLEFYLDLMKILRVKIEAGEV